MNLIAEFKKQTESIDLLIRREEENQSKGAEGEGKTDLVGQHHLEAVRIEFEGSKGEGKPLRIVEQDKTSQEEVKVNTLALARLGDGEKAITQEEKELEDDLTAREKEAVENFEKVMSFRKHLKIRSLKMRPFHGDPNEVKRAKEELLKKGLVNLHQGRPEQALENFETLLIMDPNHVKVLAAIATAQVDLENWDQALVRINQALSIEKSEKKKTLLEMKKTIEKEVEKKREQDKSKELMLLI